MPGVCAASARAPAADRIHLRAIKRSSGHSRFQRHPVVAATAVLICLSFPLCAQGLRLRVPWFPDDCPPPPPPISAPPTPAPTTAGHISVQLWHGIRNAVAQSWVQSLAGASGVMLLAFLTIQLGWADIDEQVFRRRLTTATRVSEPKVKGDLIHRQLLEDEFLHIVDTLELSVLVWGSHKTGKSTLVKTISAEQSKNGRPTLSVDVEEGDTKTDVLNRLFAWESVSGVLEYMSGLGPFRRSSNCDPNPLITNQKLEQMVEGLNRRPLFIIDNVNKLEKKVIAQLLQTAKLFVDHRIGSFVFIISGGARGRDFVSDSAMSRVKKLQVRDLSKGETFQYLSNLRWRGGVSITGGHTQGGGDAEKIYEIVGGRLEHLLTVQDHRNIEEFEAAMKKIVKSKIIAVVAAKWKPKDTIRSLSLLSAQRPLCGVADLYEISGGREDRVDRMVEENLLQFNLDERMYEFDSRLVEWYFENAHYKEFIEN